MKYSDNRYGLNAGVTVFFALISAIIFALLLAVLESTRMSAARLYMRIAVNSSIDSLFSQYHRGLWKDYRLLGLEQYDYEQLTDEMSGFMEPYFQAKNWYPMKLENIDITELICITDENGAVYEEEVLDYMKYGIAASISDLTELELFESKAVEGGSLDSISELYENHAVEAADIEKTLSDMASFARLAQSHIDAAGSSLDSCRGEAFIESAQAAIDQLDKVPEIIEKYEKQADRLAAGLKKTEEALNERLRNKDIGNDTWQSVNEDIEQYESYIKADGERRQSVLAARDKSIRNTALLQELISEAEEIIDYIDSWEPEDEDDELDEEALWRSVRARLSHYESIELGSGYGMQDEESEKRLENIKLLINSEILKLVLPEGAEISKEELDLIDSPCSMHADDAINRLGLIDRAYMAEYAVSMLNYFGRGIYDRDKIKGSGSCETEYVLYGHGNDTENMSSLITELMALRSSMNLIYLYSDSSMKNEARTLAAAITGAAGLTPLVFVMTFFILSIWSMGQAVIDIRKLLAGGRVPLIHNSESFSLTLDGLINLSAEGIRTGASRSEGSDKGLSYKDYLRIFMFSFYDSIRDYRTMDMMQMNIRKTQTDFRLDRLVRSMQTDTEVRTAHIFSELGIVKYFGSAGERGYKMKASAAFSY